MRHALAAVSLLCAAPAFAQWVPPPGGVSYPISGSHGGLGTAQPACSAGQHLTCNGSTCSCSADTGGGPSLPLSGPNGGLGQAQPTCSGNQHLTCGGTTCTCTNDPTVPTDISGAHYVTTQAEANLSAEAVLPTCSGTDKLTFNGSSISCATDQTGGGGGAPTTSKYLLQQADASLPNAQALGALGSGLVTNTTTTGIQSIYGGTSCTNQFPRSLNASGAATCASLALADFTANLGTTTTVLHGNAAGQPSFGGVALADFTANQGTTTTVLHGNGAGQPTFGAVSLTADVGATILPIANGGTNSSATATQGGVGYGTGTAHAYTGAGTTGQYLTSAGTGTPTWSTPFPRVVTSNVTNSTTTPANITGLSWSVAASTEYGFQCEILWSGTATGGPRLNLNGPASPTTVGFMVQQTTTVASTLVVSQYTAFSAAAQTIAVTSGGLATVMSAKVNGVIINGANAGTAQFMLTSSTAGQTTTVYRGSFCIVR